MIKIAKGIDAEILELLVNRDDAVFTARRTMRGKYIGVFILDQERAGRVAVTKKSYPSKPAALSVLFEGINEILKQMY